jgi:cyclopropane-fatty-acyl-phospholipid synthase
MCDDGRLFVHVFSHCDAPYLFEGTWAAERFFTGGLMPDHKLIAHFQEHILLQRRCSVGARGRNGATRAQSGGVLR